MIILQITEMYGGMHRNSKHSKWKRFLCPLGHIILLIYVSVSTLQTERFYYNIPTVCPRKTLYAWTLYLETYVYYENRVFWVFVKQLALLGKKKKNEHLKFALTLCFQTHKFHWDFSYYPQFFSSSSISVQGLKYSKPYSLGNWCYSR